MRALKLYLGTQPEYQAAEGHLITLFQKTQALHVETWPRPHSF